MNEPIVSMATHGASFEHLLRQPPVTLSAARQQARRPALIGAACGFGLFVVLSLTLARPAVGGIHIGQLLLRSGIFAALVGGSVFGVWLLGSMRRMLDQAFETFAMLTTLTREKGMLLLKGPNSPSRWVFQRPSLICALVH